MSPRRQSRPGRASRAGLALAACTGAAALALVGYFLFFRAETPRADPGPLGVMDQPPPDIKVIPTTGGSRHVEALAGGKGFFLQTVDPKDPSRVESELTAEQSEPLAARRYRLTKPVARVYLRDGRTLIVQGAQGQTTIPEGGRGGRPDDALLEGDVLVRLYAKLPDGARINPDTHAPLVTLRAARLRYNGVRGEVELPEWFTVKSESIDYSGEGLTALIDEAAQRLELATIARTHYLTFLPGAGSTTTPTPSPGAAPPPTGPAPTPPTQVAAVPLEEAFYHAFIDSPLSIRQGLRRVQAARADGWVRLVDRQLRPGAIAQAGGRPAPAPSPIMAVAASAAAPPVLGFAQPPSPQTAITDSPANREPVTMSWSGPLTIRPVKSAPELARDDVYVRLSGPSGGVEFLDAGANARGHGSRLDYAATTRRITLADSADNPARVELAGAGVGFAERFEVNLGDGRVRVPTAGELVSTAGTAGRLRWRNEADFAFALAAGRMTSKLLSAQLAGDVTASDAAAGLRGNSMKARFAPGANSAALDSLEVIGAVDGRDADGGAVTGDVLLVAFTPDDKGANQPAKVTIRGHARAARAGDVLRADEIVADLGPDVNGGRVATHVQAKRNVEFESAQGVVACADSLDADPISQHVELLGSTWASRQGSSLYGPHMTLLGYDRRLISGPGGLVSMTDPRGADSTHAAAVWSRGMAFDDVVGLAHCDGDALVVINRGAASTDTLKAAAVEVGLTPAAAEGAERTVQWCDAIGSTDQPASVEARRYAAVGERRLERLLYLESASLRAHAVDGTLAAPAPGKLLVVDRRAGDPAPGAPPAQGKGSALFTWTGSMHMDRPDGLVRMVQGVRLVHDRLGTGERTELECDELTARLRETGEKGAPGLDEDRIAGELLSAAAAGAVWMRSAGREMRADTLDYDAVSGLVDAQAIKGRKVTVLDPKTGVPTSAARALWNLKTDRVELRNTAPVTMPR